MKGWKHKKTPIIVGNEKTPTKMESGQVIINKKATKQNLNKLIDINNDGLDKEKSKISTDGTDGGLLKGKPHYDKNGNSLGGIPVVVDGGKKIEVEGDEFVVNKEASQKHWKELSKINQSAGNGVPIKPNDLGIDTDPEEYKEGGRIIQFNPNDLPSQWIYNYAKKIKQNYPKVWDKGGNIFGNEAFVNLERVIKRGYWTDSEEWMYIKWRSYVARHKKDYRIEGVVAMLKWIDKVDKGWDYMKNIIEAEIEKKYPKKKTGGVVTYKNKYNKKFGYDKNESHDLKEIAKDTEVSKRGLQKIYNKGVGAYKTNPESVRPNVKSKEQWAMARVYSAVMGGKAAKVDAKELKMEYGGGIKDIRCKCGWGWNKNQSDESDLYICHKCGNDNEMKYGGELAKGIKVEAEHQNTFNKVYAHKLNPMQATEEVAKEHIKEDKNYYSKLAKMEKFNTGGTAEDYYADVIEEGDIVRGEYFPGIYGNYLVISSGADDVQVKNLLTGIQSEPYSTLVVFLKKGNRQTTATQPSATKIATQGYGKNFKFEIGDKVIFKGNNESATIKDKEFFGGVYFYNIVFDTGIRQDDVREMDLELEKVSMPTPILPPTPTQPSQPAKPKFVPMDFQPFLQNWVNSNFINSTDLTKKEIVKDTITDFILDVEAVDGNQTIKFDQEAKILDNIDNYIN